MADSRTIFPPLSAFKTGLSGSCPRCGQGKLFSGFLSLRDRCEVCELDFSFADSADGPAVFIMTAIGFVIVGLVMAVEFIYTPPIWVHFVLWLPLILILAVAPLRPLKAIMIAQQFQKNAHEGQVEYGSSSR